MTRQPLSLQQTHQPQHTEHLTILSDHANAAMVYSPYTKVWLPTIDGHLYIQIHDICHFRAHQNVVYMVRIDQQKKYIHAPLKVLEKVLGAYGFVRAHKSYLVNMSNVHQYSKKDGGYLLMSNGNKVPVSRRNRWKLGIKTLL